jgi:hypothetical protein
MGDRLWREVYCTAASRHLSWSVTQTWVPPEVAGDGLALVGALGFDHVEPDTDTRLVLGVHPVSVTSSLTCW